MMNSVVSLGLVGLIGLVSAVPLASRQVPHYPPTSLSTGFRLVANVTDPTKDFTPSINHWVLSSVHTGAGSSDVVLSAEGGKIFYQNGTAEEVYNHRAQTQTTGGTPPFPFGLYMQGADEKDEGEKAAAPREVNLNVGSGTAGVQLQRFPVVYPTLAGPAPGTYAACDQEVPYYPGRRFTTVRFVPTGADATDAVPPEGCVAIALVAQCAELPALPEGSLASYDFANVVNCYDDVATINWAEYGP